MTAALQLTAPVSTLTSRSSVSARLQQIALSNDLNLSRLPQLISFLLAGETGRRLWWGHSRVGQKINRKWPLALVLLKRLAFPAVMVVSYKPEALYLLKDTKNATDQLLVRLYFNFVAHRKSVRALMCK